MGEKKINLLVAMLKLIACYAVVSIHFGGTLPFAGLAVPVFMFFSFYYTKFDGGGAAATHQKAWFAISVLGYCAVHRPLRFFQKG